MTMKTFIFKVYPEEVDENYRVIEIKPDQTFNELHKGILNSFDIRKKKKNASFFATDDSWSKGKEIGIFETDDETMEGALDGNETTLAKVVKSEAVNFIYVNDGITQFTFRCELEEVSDQGSEKGKYPRTIDSDGGPLVTETDELFNEDLDMQFGDIFDDDDELGSGYSEEEYY